MMNGDMMNDGMGFGMFFGMVSGFILIVGIAFLIVWAVWGPVRPKPHEPQESPLEILKKRYARGEMTKEEFEEKRKELL